MAKTDLSNGDNVFPDYLDAINGTNGSTGIILDGADTDGHGPKLLAGSHIDTSQLIPDVNLETKETFDVDASYDGGSTYTTTNVEVILNVVGNQTMLHISELLGGSMTTDESVRIKRSDSSAWPAAYFGSNLSVSTASLVLIQGLYNICAIEYVSSGSDLFLYSLANTSMGEFSNTDLIQLQAHTTFSWYKDV